MSEERFVVKDVVCDYGVYDTEFPEESFICVCKARANALLIADILNTDYSKPNECVYWKDLQLAELKAENESYDKAEQIYLARLKNASKDHDEIVNELKQHLKEKDEEINALKYLCGCPNDINEMVRKVVYRDQQIAKQYDFFQNELKSNTKQVCEKIRNRLKDLRDLEISAVRESREFEFKTEDARLEWIKIRTESARIYDGVIKILDQIEKGEDHAGFSDRRD